jgi:hypothetical protein
VAGTLMSVDEAKGALNQRLEEAIGGAVSPSSFPSSP